MPDNQQSNNESKDERKFSQEQYDVLYKCGQTGDITAWREYRKNKPNEPILLEGAEFIGTVENRLTLDTVDLSDAFLKGAKLHYTEIRYANFTRANLESAELLYSEANNTIFSGGKLRRLKVQETNLSNSCSVEKLFDK